jgi:histidine decarboxylase
VDRISRAVAYLKSNDTTLMGSRSGHAVLSIWARLFGHGYGGYAHDALRCSLRAAALAERLRASGRPVMCNPHSLTVVFDEPGADMVKRYQLATAKGQAHAIVMPNVTDDLLDRFVTDFLEWSRWAPAHEAG